MNTRFSERRVKQEESKVPLPLCAKVATGIFLRVGSSNHLLAYRAAIGFCTLAALVVIRLWVDMKDWNQSLNQASERSSRPEARI